MRVATLGTYELTIGVLIALLCLLLAILGLLNVIPMSQTVIFGLFAGLSLARLT